ncbi:SDR family oxidoreductase (plasmid) [Streptomyces sp. BI20]|uniref:SDR family oxidoreductase n=1 Tax=Streptomyces sp. BI20 TaxID=3403460 RepID=UPI003C715BDE
MRILVVGGSGHLGRSLVRRALAAGHRTASTYHRRPAPEGTPDGVDRYRLDIRDPDRIAALFRRFAPDAVVTCVSGGADREVTADGPARVARIAAETGVRLVHVSSDAVFAGDRAAAYTEDDAPDPVTPYGVAKADADAAVLAAHPGALVGRPSLVVGDGRSRHERLVLDLAAGRRAGALFTDEIRCPVHVADLAEALLEGAARGLSGVLHLGGADPVSRYELGRLLARRHGFDPGALPTARRADSGLPGGVDVRLDSTRAARLLTTELRGARAFLS